MSRYEKIFYIIVIIFFATLFFIVNLHKGTIGTGFKMFSIKNIILTASIFLIGVPLILLIKKVIHNKNKKDIR